MLRKPVGQPTDVDLRISKLLPSNGSASSSTMPGWLYVISLPFSGEFVNKKFCYYNRIGRGGYPFMKID